MDEAPFLVEHLVSVTTYGFGCGQRTSRIGHLVGYTIAEAEASGSISSWACVRHNWVYRSAYAQRFTFRWLA